MNTLLPSPASQEITRSRRIGFLVYPDCDIVDVCGPFDAFFYAGFMLPDSGEPTSPVTIALSWPPRLDRSGRIAKSSS
jgi:hypothetical protein